MRRLSKLCFILCLALGGAHDALAAALCAHFECEPGARAAAPQAPHAAEGASHEAGAASHETHAARQTHHCGARAESSEARREGAAPDTHAAAHHADETRSGTADAGSLVFAQAPANCRHCAGRPAPAPAALSERRADGPRRALHFAPPGATFAAAQQCPQSSSAVRLAPTQHAPPRRVPQYLLVSVLLI